MDIVNELFEEFCSSNIDDIFENVSLFKCSCNAREISIPTRDRIVEIFNLFPERDIVVLEVRIGHSDEISISNDSIL